MACRYGIGSVLLPSTRTLEVQVIAGGVAGCADATDFRSRAHLISDLDFDCAVDLVCVSGLSVAVGDDNTVPVAIADVARLGGRFLLSRRKSGSRRRHRSRDRHASARPFLLGWSGSRSRK